MAEGVNGLLRSNNDNLVPWARRTEVESWRSARAFGGLKIVVLFGLRFDNWSEKLWRRIFSVPNGVLSTPEDKGDDMFLVAFFCRWLDDARRSSRPF